MTSYARFDVRVTPQPIPGDQMRVPARKGRSAAPNPPSIGFRILGRLIHGVDLLCQVLLCLLVVGNTEVLQSGGDNPMANWPDSLMVASTPVEEG